MKILLVSSFLPYPLYTGGYIRLYNLLLGLSKKHEITLVAEKRLYQTKEDIKELQKFCKEVIAVERRKQWSLKNIIKTGLSWNSFLITGHTNSQMKEKVKELLKDDKFDLVHVETSYVFQNLPKKVNIPVVLTEHNIEYLVYRRFAKNARWVIKPLLYLDTLKLENQEKNFWRKADRLIAVSEEEKKIMGADAVVPNGVDVKHFTIDNAQFTKKENRILFIGDFRWVQNKDSAEFILKSIWPKVSQRSIVNGQLSLWVVGKNIPESIKRLGDENVIFDENAPSDTSEIFRRSNILLVPIMVGGGTSFKILESMASGVPVITTKLGNEGIGAKDRESILIAQTDEEFASAVENILEDKDLYIKISKNARELIKEKYDWDIIVRKLEEVYSSIVNNK